MISAALTYNRPDLAEMMVRQLGSDLLLVDNGSTPPLPQMTHYTFHIPENRFWTGGWNTVLKALYEGGHEWVWMLNDDVLEVTPEKAQLLEDVASQLPDSAAILSPTFNSPHSHMQPSNDPHQLVQTLLARNRWVNVRQVRWIDMCAPVINLNWFEHIGGFDTAFVGYGADLDLCKRLSDEGAMFYVSDDITFHHLGSLTALSQGVNAHIDVGLMNRVLHTKYGVHNWTELFP